MAGLRIAFRTDANEMIGTGHFMRCLTLADELSLQGSDICFVSRGLPAHLRLMLDERQIPLHVLPALVSVKSMDELQHAHWLGTSQAHDAQQTIHMVGTNKLDWLVIDHYALDRRFETLLRSVTKNILVIDDLADRVHDCDLLVDQNFYSNQEIRYQGIVPSHCQMLLGPTYALLRPEFKEARQRMKFRSGEVRNILVFFGGVDADNNTGKALEILTGLQLNIEMNVVIGEQHPNRIEIEKVCELHQFNCHVQTSQMATLMSKADLAIGAGGTTVWERFCLGLPSFCIATAENQKQQLNDLQLAGYVNSEAEGELSTLALTNFLDNMSSQPALLTRLSEKVATLVDGSGSTKTAAAIKEYMLHIRLANSQDERNIFEWRNHPHIRNHSKDKDEISWSSHQQWFQERLNGKRGPVLIGEVKGTAVGVVRFDIQQSDAEVSIYLVPDSNFKGWGSLLLKKSESWLRQHYPSVLTLHAKVLPDNSPSIQLFSKLNYIANEQTSPLEFLKLVESCQ